MSFVTRYSSLFVFVVALIVYLALVPQVMDTWKTLGDEPHYLLAAHSLVYDHDLDLANNYAQRDYASYTHTDYLDPHVKITQDGKQILNHDLALAFVIAPAYALGGRAGVEIFLALLGALLAVQIFLLARDVTHDQRAAALTWVALSFTPPLILYVFLVYPEIAAALIVIWAVRFIFFGTQPGSVDSTEKVKTNASAGSLSSFIPTLKLLGLGLGIALLPWLSARFIVASACLLLYALWQWRGALARRWMVWLPLVLSGVAYYGVNAVLFAGTVPGGTTAERGVQGLGALTVSAVARGLIGWWFDQQRGLLLLAPIYLIALIGLPRLIKQMPRVGVACILPLLATNVLMAFGGGFWVNFEVGPRYLVFALPLLAAPLAVAFHFVLARAEGFAWQRAGLAILAGAALVLSAFSSYVLVNDVFTAYKSSMVSVYSDILGTNLAPYLPAMGQRVVVAPDNARSHVLTTNASASDVGIVGDADAMTWFAGRGARGYIAQSLDLTELTVGNYDLNYRAAAANYADPNAEALSFDIFSAEGIPIAHSSLSGADLGGREAFKSLSFNLDNPYYDRWGFPLSLQVATTGEGDVWLGALTFEPDTARTWAVVSAWLLLAIGLVVIFNVDLVFAPQAQKVKLQAPKKSASPASLQ